MDGSGSSCRPPETPKSHGRWPKMRQAAQCEAQAAHRGSAPQRRSCVEKRERGGFIQIAIESRVVVDVYCILLRIMHCIPDDHHTTTPFVPE